MHPDHGSLLVVDDNENNRDMLGRRLERRGYTVTVASGGQQALDLIATQAFDLVLLDIMMPDIDGLGVLQTLRQTYTTIELPVIMVTVKDQSVDVVEALQLGANDYVTKPIDFPIALARIRTQLAHKRAEEALVQARNAALEMARQKAAFLAHMSHEIRTPINGVIGMSSLLLQMGLSAEQRELADIVHASADALLTLINDILDCAKLEAGKLTLEEVPFDVRTTVEGVLDVVAVQACAKQLELAVSIQPGVPTQICGDAGRLRQVLLNLVGNAIKFTAHGEVLLEVTRGSETTTHGQVRFAVRDTGTGIAAADQPCLFQTFSQAGGTTTSRTYGGTGLGLSICKQLVELMGGEIGVESIPGQGATFWFTFPYARHTPGAPAALHPQLALRGVRLLVVDDHATTREVIQQYGNAWGMHSDGAASGAEALTLLQEHAAAGTPYDLVLLDLHMPDTDGLAMARAMTAAAASVIVMVPFGQPRDAVLQATGAVASLTKPIKYTLLYTCLAESLSRPGAPGARRMPLPPQPLVGARAMPSASWPTGRRQDARILVVDENIVTQQVALHQLRKLGYAAEAVSSSAMCQALAPASYDLVLVDGHLLALQEYAAAVALCRRAGALHYTPIIAMTAAATTDEREPCLAPGIDDAIHTPVQAGDLQTILTRWLTP